MCRVRLPSKFWGNSGCDKDLKEAECKLTELLNKQGCINKYDILRILNPYGDYDFDYSDCNYKEFISEGLT